MAALAGFGEILRLHARAAGLIPQIALIMGPCIGADAFAARLSDFIFMVEETGSLYVTGPEIANRHGDEGLTVETLGGASLQTQRSGLADGAFESDIEALAQLRRLVDFLPASHQDQGLAWPSFDVAERHAPSLDTLVPDAAAAVYDVKEAILGIVDEGDFFEIQQAYAANMVIGFGRMNGHTTGILANQPLVLGGVLDANAARKAARFVRFCAAFNIALVTLVDAPGFLPGLEQEELGLARAGAELLAAYAGADVPKIAVILGQAFGAAFLMMGAKPLADSTFAWPSARIGLMKADGAVLSTAEALAQGAIDAQIEPSATRSHIIEVLARLRERPQDNAAVLI